MHLGSADGHWDRRGGMLWRETELPCDYYHKANLHSPISYLLESSKSSFFLRIMHIADFTHLPRLGHSYQNYSSCQFEQQKRCAIGKTQGVHRVSLRIIYVGPFHTAFSTNYHHMCVGIHFTGNREVGTVILNICWLHAFYRVSRRKEM